MAEPESSRLGYFDWIDGFDVPEHRSAPGADASGDGVSNLINFALGLNPLKSERDRLPMAVTETSEEGTFLLMEVHKNPDASGIDYRVEGSRDLNEWAGGSDRVVVLEEDANLLRARSADPLGEEESGFFRLRVSLIE